MEFKGKNISTNPTGGVRYPILDGWIVSRMSVNEFYEFLIRLYKTRPDMFGDVFED